jgi:hypothetical protein
LSSLVLSRELERTEPDPFFPVQKKNDIKIEDGPNGRKRKGMDQNQGIPLALAGCPDDDEAVKE